MSHLIRTTLYHIQHTKWCFCLFSSLYLDNKITITHLFHKLCQLMRWRCHRRFKLPGQLIGFLHFILLFSKDGVPNRGHPLNRNQKFLPFWILSLFFDFPWGFSQGPLSLYIGAPWGGIPFRGSQRASSLLVAPFGIPDPRGVFKIFFICLCRNYTHLGGQQQQVGATMTPGDS